MDGNFEKEGTPADALVRTRRLAAAVLGLMAAVYVATYLAGNSTVVQTIKAMAEAGLIGGLSDWFAIEALFRRPLCLPIPHTALLPRNQTRAARNVGRFLETHFLNPATLARRLRQAEPARRAIEWLARPDSATLVAQELIRLLGGLLHHEPSARTLARSRAWLRTQVRGSGAETDDVIAMHLARLVKDGTRSTVAKEVLSLLHRTVDDNRDVAVKLMQDRSRWWIASAVDRRIANFMVDSVLSLLDQLRAERSDLGSAFVIALDRMIDDLADQGVLTRVVSDSRRHLAGSGEMDTVALRIVQQYRDQLRERIAEDPDCLTGPVAGLIRDLAARALADETTCTVLNARVANIVSRLAGDLRPVIGGYVAEIIAGWKPEELNSLFEAEIGPDLQYIRINGAVLGSLIGGAIFGAETLLS